MLQLIIKHQPPVVIVIITAANEDAHEERDGTDGWARQTNDFHPGGRCACPG